MATYGDKNDQFFKLIRWFEQILFELIKFTGSFLNWSISLVPFETLKQKQKKNNNPLALQEIIRILFEKKNRQKRMMLLRQPWYLCLWNEFLELFTKQSDQFAFDFHFLFLIFFFYNNVCSKTKSAHLRHKKTFYIKMRRKKKTTIYVWRKKKPNQNHHHIVTVIDLACLMCKRLYFGGVFSPILAYLKIIYWSWMGHFQWTFYTN